MLTFGPSAMQRLLQQNKTIKQTMTGLRYQLELAVDEMQQNSEDADLATKQDVQNMMTAINEVVQYNENGHILTEVQLQTDAEWSYLAVCGTNGVIHKLLENQLLHTLTAHKANELLYPLSLYLDRSYRWTIVAIGIYQELDFAGRALIVDGVRQAAAVGAHNYLLPESLEKSDGTNRWVLGWG